MTRIADLSELDVEVEIPRTNRQMHLSWVAVSIIMWSVHIRHIAC